MSYTSDPGTRESDSGHRRILRSTSIIGGVSLFNLFLGLLRIKLAALLLGPAGIGLIGLMQSLVTMASTVAALGFGTAGTRQIAEAVGRKDVQGLRDATRALLMGTLALSMMGGFLVWMFRDVLALEVLGNPSQRHSVGWLALGVALTVAAGSQVALLSGLRRIGDLARVSVASAIGSTVLGIAAVSIWGEKGILAFVVAAPLTNFAVGHWYVAKLPPYDAHRTELRILVTQWKSLARLGIAFMVTGLVGSAGQLTVRMLIERELGAEAVGQFHASWMIAMTYIAFVLGAMGADFYPRLTAVLHDHVSCRRLVNEQTEVALLLAGPVLLAMLALAPWVIELLYSHEFAEAAVILRWQLFGDVLMVISWPLAFIVLAAGKGSTYMLIESLSTSVFVILVWIGLPLIGLQATGLAFIGLYVVYLPLVYWRARRQIGFVWILSVKLYIAFLVAASIFICLVGAFSNFYAAILGMLVTIAFGVFSLNRLSHMSGVDGAVAGVIWVGKVIANKMGAGRK